MSDDDLPKHWDFLGGKPGEDPNQPETNRSSEGVSPIAERTRPSASPEPENPYTKPRKKKKGFFFRFVVFPVLFFGILGIIAFLAGAIYFHVEAGLLDFEKLKETPQRTLVYDRNGDLMGHVSGHGKNREIIPISKVSKNFLDPLLAREDSNFYKHGGVDYVGVARAMVTNVKSGNIDQGASTITMQLARNTFDLTGQSLKRKAKEVAISRRLERKLEKDEILSYYVNRVYFGSGLYGIERASQGFFMKPASELTIGEGAMLAGVIRGPSILNPFRNLKSAIAVRDETLARMVNEEMITQEEADKAKATPIVLRPPEKRFATGSYVLQQIHDLLGDALQSEEQIKRGGLRVYCTIDASLQKAAESALDSHLTKLEARSGWEHPKRKDHKGGEKRSTNYVQGAVVSLENSSGAILSYVGGRSYNESPYNRAVNASRQVGSTFKPFVYAVAFDRGGLLPGTLVSDDAYVWNPGDGGPTWRPRNYDGTFQGMQPASWGLIKSRNTLSIRVGDVAGLNNVRSLAGALQLGSIPSSPVSYLGAFEATPMTMTSAYSTLANGGTSYAPYLIEKIENSTGKILFQNKPRGKEIFRESVTWLTSDVLGKVFSEGTARSARSTYQYKTPAYGKTGTTNDNFDGWFMGYTSEVTTGVWVGMDNPKRVMYKGTGSSLALPVWTSVMKTADEIGYQGKVIEPPAGSELVSLCRKGGLLASRATSDAEHYSMVLPPDLVPRSSCKGHTKRILPIITARQPDWLKRQNEAEKANSANAPKKSAFKKISDFFKRL